MSYPFVMSESLRYKFWALPLHLVFKENHDLRQLKYRLARGASFGAQSVLAPHPGLDVDRVLSDELASSTPQQPLHPAEEKALSLPETYQRWKVIFAPNAAFRAAAP